MVRLTGCYVMLCAALLVGCEGDDQAPGSASGGNTGAAAGGGPAGEGAGGAPGEPSLLPIGAPCLPWEESDADTGGSSLNEMTFQLEDPVCQSQLCLVNHFQGRVTCPYGQTQEDLALPADDGRRCRTVDWTTREMTDEPVTRAVRPQLVDRRAEDVVTCSCRCAGPDPDAEYCACPEGMECVELAKELGVGSEERAGSYCIKAGTAYDGEAAGLTCGKDSAIPERDCGGGRQNP